MVPMERDGALLVSDSLRDRVPELEGLLAEAAEVARVIVVVERAPAAACKPMVGIMRGVLLSAAPELEFCCELEEALDVLTADEPSFMGFEVHYGERRVRVEGPFVAVARRLDEIDVSARTCTLGLHLQKRG